MVQECSNFGVRLSWLKTKSFCIFLVVSLTQWAWSRFLRDSSAFHTTASASAVALHPCLQWSPVLQHSTLYFRGVSKFPRVFSCGALAIHIHSGVKYRQWKFRPLVLSIGSESLDTWCFPNWESSHIWIRLFCERWIELILLSCVNGVCKAISSGLITLTVVNCQALRSPSWLKQVKCESTFSPWGLPVPATA